MEAFGYRFIFIHKIHLTTFEDVKKKTTSPYQKNLLVTHFKES